MLTIVYYALSSLCSMHSQLVLLHTSESFVAILATGYRLRVVITRQSIIQLAHFSTTQITNHFCRPPTTNNQPRD